MPRTTKICQSNFRSWPILSTPGSARSGLSASSAAPSAIWSGATSPRNRPRAAVAALAVRQRHVAGFVRRDAPAKSRTAPPASDRDCWSGMSSATKPSIAGALDPGFQPIEAAHGLVFGCGRILAWRAASRARRGQRLRRERCQRITVRRVAGSPAGCAVIGRLRSAAAMARLSGLEPAPRACGRGATGAPRAASCASGFDRRSVSMSANSATRRVSELNSIALRKAISRL